MMMLQHFKEELCYALTSLRDQTPIVHVIPNSVSATFCADALAAIGARPIMAIAPEESAIISATSNSVVLNLGQLTTEKKEALITSSHAALTHSKPIVFDPVGVGASQFRLDAALQILDINWQGIVRLNQSELQALSTRTLTHTGVDAGHIQSAYSSPVLPREDLTYLVTGEKDYIYYNNRVIEVLHLSQFAPRIVGTGCVLSCICGAFLALDIPSHIASLAASITMAIATYKTELALKEYTTATVLPYGSYKQYLLDSFSSIDENDIEEYLSKVKGEGGREKT